MQIWPLTSLNVDASRVGRLQIRYWWERNFSCQKRKRKTGNLKVAFYHVPSMKSVLGVFWLKFGSRSDLKIPKLKSKLGGKMSKTLIFLPTWEQGSCINSIISFFVRHNLVFFTPWDSVTTPTSELCGLCTHYRRKKGLVLELGMWYFLFDCFRISDKSKYICS